MPWSWSWPLGTLNFYHTTYNVNLLKCEILQINFHLTNSLQKRTPPDNWNVSSSSERQIEFFEFFYLKIHWKAVSILRLYVTCNWNSPCLKNPIRNNLTLSQNLETPCLTTWFCAMRGWSAGRSVSGSIHNYHLQWWVKIRNCEFTLQHAITLACSPHLIMNEPKTPATNFTTFYG